MRNREAVLRYIYENERYHNGNYKEVTDKFPEFSYEAIRRIARKVRNLKSKKGKPDESLNMTESDGEMKISGTATSVEELLDKAGVDMNVWYIDWQRIDHGYNDVSSKWRDQDLKWDVVDGQQFMTGHAKRKNEWIKTRNEKFSISVILKRKVPIIDIDRFKRELIEELKSLAPKVKGFNYVKALGDNERFAIAPLIFDLHFGLYVWAPETGGSAWDLNLAERDFSDSFDDIVAKAVRAAGGEKYIDEIMIPVGNDFFNSDKSTPYPQTTKGTPQQEDARWQDVFVRGRRLLQRKINEYSSLARVKLKVVRGNHDDERAFFLGDSLECYYHNNENVIVDNGPKLQKYWRYGKTLIGLTHGSPKREGTRLDSIMQFEVPDHWSQTYFREWWLGDIHHKKVKEIVNEDKQGLYFRWMRTLMPTSEWENSMGYKSMKGAEGFLVSYERGPEFEIRTNKVVEVPKKEII